MSFLYFLISFINSSLTSLFKRKNTGVSVKTITEYFLLQYILFYPNKITFYSKKNRINNNGQKNY